MLFNKQSLKFIPVILFFMATVGLAKLPKTPVIEFVSEEGSKSLTLEQLKKTFKPREVSTFNLNTSRVEVFHAFSMDNIFHKFWRTIHQANNFVKLECSDGYIAYIEAEKFRTNQAYLAFSKKGSTAFTTVGPLKNKVIKLGTFYLVWKESYKKGKATRRRHHWPWKIEKISLIKELPSHLKPLKTSSVDTNWGYLNYVKQCLPCHSLNGFGGKVGPDLLTYSDWKSKDDKWLKLYISQPRKLYPNSKMPPFPKTIDIRNIRIRNIVLYLRHLTSTEYTKKSTTKRLRYSHKDLLKKIE